MSTIDPVQDLLGRLDGVKQTGPDQYMARCPSHDDRHASLSIGRGDDGRVLMHCQAGCAVADVAKTLGLTMSDLYPAKPGRVSLAGGNAAKAKPATAKAQIVAAYDYCDAHGNPLYQVVRFEPKDFRQRRSDAEGHWAWGLSAGEYAQATSGDWYKVNDRTPVNSPRRQFPTTPRALYRLPELLAADKGAWVFVVEGEKDADNLAALGLVATTNPGGAGKWKHLADDSALHGRRVAILWDRDAPNDKGKVTGWDHAQDVAARLHGMAAVVRIIDLPDIPPKDNGEPRKDVSDWIEWLDSKTGEELAAALVKMAEDAPDWAPPPVVSASTPAARPIEAYHPFPVDCLPEPMRSFVAQAAETIGCDAAFVALPLLAASASAIGNTRRIALKRGWTEPAILWAAIVGDSGTLKSPALELALRALRRRQHEAKKRYDKEMTEYNEALLRHEIAMTEWKRAKGEGPRPEEPKEPVFWRSWCDDTTIEALAVLLLQNWRGILMVRDELAGWLGGFDRYAQMA